MFMCVHHVHFRILLKREQTLLKEKGKSIWGSTPGSPEINVYACMYVHLMHMVCCYKLILFLPLRSPCCIYPQSSCIWGTKKPLNPSTASRSSLESFTSAYSQKPGISYEYLCEQWKGYCAHKQKISNDGQPVPFLQGVLIFDEIKVQNGVSCCIGIKLKHTVCDLICRFAGIHQQIVLLV